MQTCGESGLHPNQLRHLPIILFYTILCIVKQDIKQDININNINHLVMNWVDEVLCGYCAGL